MSEFEVRPTVNLFHKLSFHTNKVLFSKEILKKNLQKNGIDTDKGVDLENGECKKWRHTIYEETREAKGAELSDEEVYKIRSLIRSNERGCKSTRGREYDVIGSGKGRKKRGCEGEYRRHKKTKTADPSARRAEARRVQEMLEGLYKQPDSWN